MMHIQLLQCPIPNHLAFLGPGFPPSLLQKGGHGRWPIPYNRGMAGLGRSRRRIIICCGGMGFLGLVDPWAPTVGIESQSIASQLFAFSLFPYIGFLYFITKSNSAPKLTLFGFYFLLAFVGATTKVHYGTSLSNVDWLHGGAESLLTLTNLFIVIGLRQALRIRKTSQENDAPNSNSSTKQPSTLEPEQD
ncbi:uncharacterized protein LOC127787072 isoform X2 [Diospyros lotus]|uniref:uncharacterized protein LOC127787072 isoform X2 n=1 Tax=Diospyros lotus TaxID=55363 RepID=UPI002253C5EA|nr:uncharacterized protein LOC127787072 isoform X2 [Diospyros lotus]